MKRITFVISLLLWASSAYAFSTPTCFDSDCKLMLHMNGTDTSKTFIDSSSAPKTVTANADAQLDTAQKQFGTASGLFDGNGDELSIPDSIDWYMGTGSFTIDFWTRFNALPTDGNFQYLFQDLTDSNNRVGLYILNTSGVYSLNFFFYVGASVTASVAGNITIATNEWGHIAIVRNGTGFNIYYNGTSVGNATDSDEWPNLTGNFYIGSNGSSSYTNGWIDEFRIVKGTAVWTSNFSIPADEYTPCTKKRIFSTVGD